MTKSVRSINILVRLDFIGHDVSNESVQTALDNMHYEFSYDDYHIRLVGTEIIDTFVKDSGDQKGKE